MLLMLLEVPSSSLLVVSTSGGCAEIGGMLLCSWAPVKIIVKITNW